MNIFETLLYFALCSLLIPLLMAVFSGFLTNMKYLDGQVERAYEIIVKIKNA